MAYTGKKPIDHTDVTQSQSMTVTDDLTVGGDLDAATAVFDRASTDGTIVDLQKDGTSVGSIGAFSTSTSYTGASSGIYFNGVNINPTTGDPTVRTDNINSIGQSSQRFKDLYLGGGVYLGGTGSANHLEDYEEGNWTPAFTNATGLTLAHSRGVYTKVGNICTFILDIKVDTWTSPNTNFLELTLPFTSHNEGTGYTPAVAFWETGWSYNTQKPQALIFQNQSIVRMLAGNYGVAGNNYISLRQNNVTAADLWVRIQGTYRVA